MYRGDNYICNNKFCARNKEEGKIGKGKENMTEREVSGYIRK